MALLRRKSSDRQLDSSSVLADEARARTPEDALEQYPEGGWEAWGVVLGGFLLFFVSFGLGTNTLGVFQTYWYNERPGGPLASQFAISWTGSFQVWCSYASALIAGPTTDRLGARPCIAVGTVFFVAACMLISVADSYWSVFLAQGVLQGISIGVLMSPALAVASQYFTRRRALALGMVAAGSSLGGVVWPIVLDRLIHHGPGFPWAMRICGFIALILLSTAFMLVKTRLPPLETGPFLDLQAFRLPSFSLLLLGQTVVYLGLFFMYFYLPSLGAQNGMPSGKIFYLASAGNGASFFGRTAAGLLGDRYGKFNCLIISLLMSATIVLATIPVSRLHGNAIVAPLYIVDSLYGFVSGAFFANQIAALISICKESGRIGTWIGMLYAALSLPGLFGPPIGAQLIQRSGFPAALAFSAIMMLLGATLITASRLSVQRSLVAVL